MRYYVIYESHLPLSALLKYLIWLFDSVFDNFVDHYYGVVILQ